MTHHFVLVPGFLGFGNLGELKYFAGVREALVEAMRELGVDGDVVEVQTLPTASIRYRAARVLEAVALAAASGEGPLHVIGHSTGGLDARLAISPNAALPTEVAFADYDRIRSIVTVSTPHYGTPLAALFSSVMGTQLLRLWSALLLRTLENRRLPLRSVLRLGYLVTRIDDRLGFRRTVFDQLYEQLLADFTDERRRALIDYVGGVRGDRSILFQLTAAGCDLLNASTADPIGVAYGSVVTRGRPPSVRQAVRHAYDFYTQAFHLLYAALHFLASHSEPARLATPSPEQLAALEQALGFVPSPTDSDGIVPTLSQVWGRVIHAASADHLDVVGHFGRSSGDVIHADWLPSYSGFDEEAFRATWRAVAAFATST